MKRFTAIAAALALSASPVFAGQDDSKQAPAGPVQMTDAQMDSVAAGLITVVAVDTVDVNNNDVVVQVPVNVSAAVAALGEATSVAVQRGPGRITQ